MGFGSADQAGQGRLSLRVLKNGESIVALHDEEGLVRAALDLMLNGVTVLVLSTGEHNNAVLGLDAKGNPFLELHDADGNLVFEAPDLPDDRDDRAFQWGPIAVLD